MCDHDNDLSVLLPDHLPEGGKGALNRTLSSNVGSRLAEAVNEVGIQVVFTVVPTVSVGFIILRTAFWPQSHSSVIIWVWRERTFYLQLLGINLSKIPILKDISIDHNLQNKVTKKCFFRHAQQKKQQISILTRFFYNRTINVEKERARAEHFSIY